MVKDSNQHLETLSEIRSLMERSSRFISLSGLSGVIAGTLALLGAAAVYVYLEMNPFQYKLVYYEKAIGAEKWGMNYLEFFVLDAGLVLAGALFAGIFLTTRKARNKGQKVWNALTRRLLINLAIPLLTGGIFILALLKYGLFGLVAPSTLVFYGLALLNGSKYTLNDIRYLGVTEIALGLTGLFIPGYGLELWTIGFGLLHIIYGARMYYKYER
ncbi:MAG: hypothetical protein KDC44_01510 [Phaeodactylibacter sp.]|nr:hypothetical protein [Phaeodactylibacter sp.]